MEEQEGRLYFEEEQRFPSWLLVGVGSVPLALGLSLLTSSTSAKDASVIADLVVTPLVILLLLYSLKLTVKLYSTHLHVRVFPFARRYIPLDDIDIWLVRAYNPIREYGGWGFRGRPGKWVYSLGGNQGVQLDLANGENLLIGSRRPEELARAITLAKSES